MSKLQQQSGQRRSFRWAAVVATSLAVVTLAGCATHSASGNVYTYNQAQREQTTRMGTVVGVRNVVIQPQSTTGVGTIAGAAVGGIAGNTIGGGSGRAIATVLGGLAGGLAGTATERTVTRKAGYEITVRMDTGEHRVITQEADIDVRRGERVQIVTGSGVARVLPVR